ncbi:flavin-containing monooxygenase 5-like [Tubulanus polymorphus]|uniref:flavin-containing monooxygenase 5-like n=1 Tax=Tubulanus polymorphus TaxID=672921 RepID=UPI003DA1FF27
MMQNKRIAIIGAGCSGLTAIKCCLDEGLEPVCFEMDDDIGGLWNYTDDTRPGQGSVYHSCIINTSKEMMAFSDFPVPSHFPPFMPHKYVLKYFRLYAKNFNLLQHIKFSCCVESVRPAADFAETGRWEVFTRPAGFTDSNETSEIFDGVMICTGHHVYPHIPNLPGLNKFKGEVIHTHDYKRPESYSDKKVLIIGIGNSAVDVAVDLSRVCSKVYLSTRRGAWIVNRMGPWGIPADALANSRFMFSLPQNWLQWMVEKLANYRFDHETYGVKPSHRALEAHPTINDELPQRIMTGGVQVRTNVRTFTGDGVEFDDGTFKKIDAVVLATGYNYQFKFVDESILKINRNDTSLFKYTFVPDLQHPTLAVIGLVQAIGAVMPIAEMQCRWYTRVVKGIVQLPSRDDMNYDILKKKEAMKNQYVSCQRHTLQTFWISFMDQLASEVGVKPNLKSMFFEDPFLTLRCFFGPCVPAQYRLNGPGKWPGAKKTIQSAFINMSSATRTRSTTGLSGSSGLAKRYVIIILGIMLFLLCALKLNSI